MKNLYEPTVVDELQQRLARLRADAAPLWGKMNPGQAVAHCAAGVELALGERRPPRMMIGRLLGPMIKRAALRDDAPMRKNSPTVPGLVVNDERNLEVERQQLSSAINRFAAAGPAACTNHPHSFFGPLTPAEWSALVYKHLDHHFRQFGV